MRFYINRSFFALVAVMAIAATFLLPPLVLAAETSSETLEQSIDKTNAPVLHTRTFKVDPIPFMRNLLNVKLDGSSGGVVNGNFFGNPGTNSLPTATDVQLAVINFFKAVGVELEPPKSVFFSDRRGMLTVHAADDDLELIEAAINTWNIVTPEVSLSVRFVEVGDDAVFKPGFEWFLTMITTGSKAAILGILTESQSKTLLANLDQNSPGASLWYEAQITTLSGRQANFGVVDPLTITTNTVNINFQQEATNSPFSLDIVPYVETNGYTIQLSLITTVTEILGNSAPANSLTVGTNSGIPLDSQLPLPRSRVRQMVTSCIVWDGQTVVLLLKPPYASHVKNLVALVTPTVVNSDGNRVNLPENMPFAQNSIPPQSAR
jgi:hypothetical protein